MVLSGVCLERDGLERLDGMVGCLLRIGKDNGIWSKNSI